MVQSIYSSRTLLSDVLDAVSLVVPENAWFQSLQLTASDPVPAGDRRGRASSAGDGKISIEGQTYSFEDVSRLIVRLQLIPSLTGVELTSANQAQEASGSQLEIKGLLHRRLRAQQAAGQRAAADRSGGAGAMSRKIRYGPFWRGARRRRRAWRGSS